MAQKKRDETELEILRRRLQPDDSGENEGEELRGDEIELDEEDEEILDKVWEEIGKEDAGTH